MNETKAKWRRANLDKGRAAQKKWAAANPEKVKEIQRRKYLARREELLALAKSYAGANRDRIKAYLKAYAASPEGRAIRVNAEHRRRAKMRGSYSPATNTEIRALLASAECCRYCAEPFDKDRRKPTLDHIVALANGGSHSLHNLAVACGPCNSRKGTRDHTAMDFT